jgi:hypothetical protein
MPVGFVVRYVRAIRWVTFGSLRYEIAGQSWVDLSALVTLVLPQVLEPGFHKERFQHDHADQVPT